MPQAPSSAPSAPPPVAVRAATPADAPVLVAFNAAMAHETEGLTLDRATLEAGVAAALGGGAGARYFVAEAAAAAADAADPPSGSPASRAVVVGALMITLEWSDWRNADCWWVQSVYVAPAFRGRGVFKRLYAAVRAAAADAGACGVRLYADDGNEAAQDVYRRLGMTSHYRVYEDMF